MSGLIGLIEFDTAGEKTRYCSRNDDILWGGFIWYKAPIRADDTVQTSALERNNFKLQFPMRNAFAMQFMGYGPDTETSVTVRRNSQMAPDDFTVVWTGRVSDWESNGDTITLVCEDILSSVSQAGLTPCMQKFCRHVVYQLGCNLDSADFAISSSISAIDSQLLAVTCTAAAAYPDNYFLGGMLALPSGALRYVVAHKGDTLTLWRPAPEIADALAMGSVTTTLYPGCDGSLDICNDRFNNLDNNGGFYWIPKNPYDGSAIF